MPYPTPVFKQHYMLQELGMACNTWFLVVRARVNVKVVPGHRGNAIIRKVKPVSLGQQVRRG